MTDYGTELILDIHETRHGGYTRAQIEAFLVDLCKRIDMKRADLHFWDYDGYPDDYAKAPEHLQGTSAVQFIQTSNVTIHTLDKMRRVYLNIFSCKAFDPETVKSVTLEHLGGRIVAEHMIARV